MCLLILYLPSIMDAPIASAPTRLPISAPPSGPVVDISGNQLTLLSVLPLKFHCFGKVLLSRKVFIISGMPPLINRSDTVIDSAENIKSNLLHRKLNSLYIFLVPEFHKS